MLYNQNVVQHSYVNIGVFKLSFNYYNNFSGRHKSLATCFVHTYTVTIVAMIYQYIDGLFISTQRISD